MQAVIGAQPDGQVETGEREHGGGHAGEGAPGDRSGPKPRQKCDQQPRCAEIANGIEQPATLSLHRGDSEPEAEREQRYQDETPEHAPD
jgi:hypothetical protein